MLRGAPRHAGFSVVFASATSAIGSGVAIVMWICLRVSGLYGIINLYGMKQMFEDLRHLNSVKRIQRIQVDFGTNKIMLVYEFGLQGEVGLGYWCSD